MDEIRKKKKAEKVERLEKKLPIGVHKITKPLPTGFEVDVKETFKELEVLLLKKHKDYGPRNISDAPGGALNGLRVRMHDKLARINNLHGRSTAPANESLEDSFKDLANYAIIGLLVLRGKWDTK